MFSDHNKYISTGDDLEIGVRKRASVLKRKQNKSFLKILKQELEIKEKQFPILAIASTTQKGSYGQVQVDRISNKIN